MDGARKQDSAIATEVVSQEHSLYVLPQLSPSWVPTDMGVLANLQDPSQTVAPSLMSSLTASE